MSLMEYNEVISSLQKKRRETHLLLGNGFSMAYDPNIFSYNALHDFIHTLDNELLSTLFEIVKTKNFELVMQQLDNFCELIEVFGSDESLKNKVEEATLHLKHTLIDAIKELHPDHVFEVDDEKIKCCSKFLSTYLDCGGNIFTTNYDILLYWVLMRSEIRNPIDGFGREVLNIGEYTSEDEVELSELIWGINKKNQNIHYVHGALPIFDTGIDIIKEEYDGEHYLLENIEERIEQKEYPVFVTSGNGDDKLSHIMHNRYLTFCYEKLSNIEGSLVTFGFNFGPYDHHIIEAINSAAKHGRRSGNKLFSIYIGVYSGEAREHIESIAGKFKCKVQMFDARSANVWGK
jgi:hypothetical protein